MTGDASDQCSSEKWGFVEVMPGISFFGLCEGGKRRTRSVLIGKRGRDWSLADLDVANVSVEPPEPAGGGLSYAGNEGLHISSLMSS